MPPRLTKEIREVIDLFGKVNTQWVVSMNGLVGLNYQSVQMIADIEEYELTPHRMMILQTIESFYLEKNREKEKHE